MSSSSASERQSLGVAVLTVSDTRSEENDTSGQYLVDSLQQAGHTLVAKKIVIDDVYLIRAVISAWIANPPKRSGPTIDERDRPPKAPGMAPTLASEFLRNLGWDGFKPDRHIQRLFTLWFPDDGREVADRVDHLCDRIGRRDKATRQFAQYALIGIRRSPEGTPLSKVDNLVWALGAYVEKKGAESDFRGV